MKTKNRSIIRSGRADLESAPTTITGMNRRRSKGEGEHKVHPYLSPGILCRGECAPDIKAVAHRTLNLVDKWITRT